MASDPTAPRCCPACWARARRAVWPTPIAGAPGCRAPLQPCQPCPFVLPFSPLIKPPVPHHRHIVSSFLFRGFPHSLDCMGRQGGGFVQLCLRPCSDSRPSHPFNLVSVPECRPCFVSYYGMGSAAPPPSCVSSYRRPRCGPLTPSMCVERRRRARGGGRVLRNELLRPPNQEHVLTTPLQGLRFTPMYIAGGFSCASWPWHACLSL